MPQRWGWAKGEAQGRRLAERRARQGPCGDAGGPNRARGKGGCKGGGWHQRKGGCVERGMNRGGGVGEEGTVCPTHPTRYTSIVYMLFGFFIIIFYIVIAIFTLKNKMKDKKKN